MSFKSATTVTRQRCNKLHPYINDYSKQYIIIRINRGGCTILEAQRMKRYRQNFQGQVSMSPSCLYGIKSSIQQLTLLIVTATDRRVAAALEKSYWIHPDTIQNLLAARALKPFLRQTFQNRGPADRDMDGFFQWLGMMRQASMTLVDSMVCASQFNPCVWQRGLYSFRYFAVGSSGNYISTR
jgi:hypothetical protein